MALGKFKLALKEFETVRFASLGIMKTKILHKTQTQLILSSKKKIMQSLLKENLCPLTHCMLSNFSFFFCRLLTGIRAVTLQRIAPTYADV